MKIGLRTPSLKKSFKARTTGKLKRQMKRTINPIYGKKGVGMITNPKKAVYNKVYNKTTVGLNDIIKSSPNKQNKKSSIVQNINTAEDTSWKQEAAMWNSYDREVKHVADRYFSLHHKIEENWSKLFQSKQYNSKLADIIEKDCIKDIEYYMEMRKIDIKYKLSSPNDIPALRRLAMLYEKQGRYEEAVKACNNAISLGMDEHKRLERILKKQIKSFK
ncbi:tetratricopeptide repeat protein [Anaerofustis stercorihominis]|uniref:tetratricopeptide repeat protein n=1 Tax=Anaerofustis stercorihominis TaxID=214853 RepID=UPI0011062393|nr:tetratricopeptide repeat protein [Anaerofustis stercorihominis]